MKVLKFTLVIAISMLFSATGFTQEKPQLENEKPINHDTLQQRLFGDTKSQASKTDKKPDFAYGAFQRGEYLTAFQIALPLAEKGDAAAQTLIAELYEKGLGIAQDTKQAAVWYEIAAKSGNREAKFALSLKLLKGKDVPKDEKRGAELLKQAADAGSSRSSSSSSIKNEARERKTEIKRERGLFLTERYLSKLHGTL